jgi:hypothetical protein
MNRVDRITVRVLRMAASRIARERSRGTYGACRACRMAEHTAFRGRLLSPLRHEVNERWHQLLSVFARDAERAGPFHTWWGLNFGSTLDYLPALEEVKGGRILMLLFLAEAVEAGDL